MKIVNKIIIVIAIVLMMFFISLITYKLGTINGRNVIDKKEIKEEEKEVKEVKEKNNFVSYNGNLKIKDNKLVNEQGEIIQLKGISSHGIQWFGNYITEDNIKELKKGNVNVFRIAMYTKENGYIDNNSLKNDVIKYVDLVIKNDMYVIIDWHILSDGDPLTYKDESIKFFDEMSKKYKNSPNVIYEICNEPNGNVNWDDNIKPYAEEVIDVIRKNSDGIILVGTPTWSQEIDKPAQNPIKKENIMYTLHFYSGTHTSWLRDRAKEAMKKIPIFVSEFGVSDASGNGGVFLEEADKWIKFLDENNISYVNWSLSDKNESSAMLKTGSNGVINDNNLSESGKFVKQAIK